MVEFVYLADESWGYRGAGSVAAFYYRAYYSVGSGLETECSPG